MIMAGLSGGMFTALSLTLCEGLSQAGLGWMYFLLMGGIAILLGAFGRIGEGDFAAAAIFALATAALCASGLLLFW